ncbi:transposase [Candidatus Vampirococcus lugosii]|uniref:Transposase n=1 Tax=Candidatus Vampirococcus lugosii TaxID=2789015 RepID=A0ABS5QLF6_9BACT|nr:transposase [Candidatus Vampirococcus lugosii]MBS8122025.1 Transposase [Candidatus Vampirococcus lugosii]
MPIRYFKLYPYIYYHIFNRGFEQQRIFYEHSDYDRFYKIILKYSKGDFSKIDLVSYCFLPNHFHFILISKSETENYISNFMRKIQQSYAQYFKAKYGTGKGPVFDGRFKVKAIQDDVYLQKCFVYVNFNAIKHGIVDNINDWNYTSFHILEKGEKETYRNINNTLGILKDLEF